MNGLISVVSFTMIYYFVKSFLLSFVWVISWLPFIFVMRKISADKKYSMLLVIFIFLPFLPLMKVDSFIHDRVGVVSSFEGYNHVNIEKIITQRGVSEKFFQGRPLAGTEKIDPGNCASSGYAGFLARIRYIDVLLLLWFSGFILFIVKYIRGFYTLKGILYRSRAADNGNFKNVYRHFRDIGKKWRKPGFRISTEINSPVSFGLLRPMVIFPLFISDEMNESGTRQIIVHELAHINRKDFAVVIIQRIIEAIFFFNPLVWYLSGNLQELQEESCDDIVFQYNSDRLGYAENLVKILSHTVYTKSLAVNGMSGGGKNLKRIKKILHPGRKMKNQGLKKTAAILASGIAAGCLFVTCSNTSVNNTGKGIDSSGFPHDVAVIIDEMNDYYMQNTMIPLMESDSIRMKFLNKALDKASGIKDENVKKRTILNLQLMKTDFLYDIEESKKICTEQLPVAVKLGDRVAEARCLIKLGEYGRIFKKKQKNENEKKISDAVKIFRETGRNDLLQWALISDIGNSFEEKDLQKAFSVSDELIDIMKKTGKEDDTVIAHAVYGFVNELKNIYHENELLLYNCTAEIFTRGKDGRVIYSGEPGFGGHLNMSEKEMALFDYPMYWMLGNSGGIAYEWLKKGKSEIVKSFSFNREYLQSIVTCVSVNETIEVPAGIFNNCRHINIITKDTPGSEAEDKKAGNSKKINEIIKGGLDIWYASGTGIVKLTRKREGTESSLVLTGYTVSDNSKDSFFPLKKGSLWEYTVLAGKTDSYRSKYVSKVESENEGRYYFSHYGYVVKNKLKK